MPDLGYYRCPVDGCGYEDGAETVVDEAFNARVVEHTATHASAATLTRRLNARRQNGDLLAERDVFDALTGDQP